jgi:CheY-like chemotaxis protein
MGRGTGLGLAAVYGIIKGHGGYIEVESEKNQGAAFSIYLPASEIPLEKQAEVSRQGLGGNETILFVDDEEKVLKVGVEMLQHLGYTVLESSTGKEAVEIYRENKDRIDLVILDMIMPGMGGGAVYDCIKEINERARVLLSSGYSVDGEAQKILERGCNGFIQKPFNLEELSRKIRQVLDAESCAS